MKILIDIGHPAHVHYFRNFIKIMESKGHQFVVVARNKEVTFQLLNYYKIPFISRGNGKNSLVGKLFYILLGDYIIMKEALRFKPDLFLSFASPYAAHVSFLLMKYHIAFDDTEHAKLEHIMYIPFTSVILTPRSFYKYFGEKQIKFSGFMELCSLHPTYFKPDNNVLNELGVKENDKFVIIRFISWEASHDIGINGIDLDTKFKFVKEISKHAKVFISSEGDLPEQLKMYKLPTPPEKIHDVLSFATLYIGEGATTASECVALGTPAIYVNNLDAGTLREQAKYGLLINKRNANGILDEAVDLIKRNNLKKEWQKRRQKMLSEKIDVTAFMVWFVEYYPESLNIMKKNPDYQYKFR